MFPVVVLCGGKGTRLHELTRDQIPKVLVDVNRRPFLDWKLKSLDQMGFTDIRLAVSHLAEQIVARYPYNRVEWDEGHGPESLIWADHAEPLWFTYGDSLVWLTPDELYEIQTSEHRMVYTALRSGERTQMDYGLMFTRPGGRGTVFYEVDRPFFDINTPEAVEQTGAYLCNFGLTPPTSLRSRS